MDAAGPGPGHRRGRAGLDSGPVDPLAGPLAGRHPHRAGQLPLLLPTGDMPAAEAALEPGAVGHPTVSRLDSGDRTMATDFKRGDHVEWNSEAGRVRGTIQKK